jgi:hypothetical protein
MPAKNTIKTYIKDGNYHVYNRGVEKRHIFMDTRDYEVFLRYLKDALLPLPDPKSMLKTVSFKGSTFKGVPRQPNNFNEKMVLIAYCLMPNHFHLLVKQSDETSLKDFMKSISTRYAIYFNKRYKRVGPLFQNIYKASIITDDFYLLHLSRYIHLNPKKLTNNLNDYYSSYGDFLGKRHSTWVNPQSILAYFHKGPQLGLPNAHSYRDFVENSEVDSVDLLGNDTLDSAL